MAEAFQKLKKIRFKCLASTKLQDKRERKEKAALDVKS